VPKKDVFILILTLVNNIKLVKPDKAVLIINSLIQVSNCN